MDDPVLSPEAQQVIDRLRTLLTQLEKDLEEIRFKAMDTSDSFPRSGQGHWYCLPLLGGMPGGSGAGFLAGFCWLNAHRALGG